MIRVLGYITAKKDILDSDRYWVLVIGIVQCVFYAPTIKGKG